MSRVVAALFLALTILVTGCGGAIANSAHVASQAATQTAVDTVTSPEETKKLDALASSVTTAARNAAFDPDTTAKVQELVQALGKTLRAELAATDAQLKSDLLDMVQQLVKELIVEVGPLREEIQKQVDALLADATAKIPQTEAAAIAPVKAEAERYAIGFGLALVLVVVLFCVLRGIDRRAHRERFEAVEAKLAKQES